MWDRGTKQVSDFYLVTESTVSQAFTVSRSEQQTPLRCNSASSMSVSNLVVELNYEPWYFVIVGVIRFLQCAVKYNVLKPEQWNDPSLYCTLSQGSMDSEWWARNDTNAPFGPSCVVSSRRLS